MAQTTNVRPFSNGSEADYWRARNCDRCTKCGEPDTKGRGPCAIETAVSLGSIIGTIPVAIATRAGATIRGEYCDMPKQCAEFAPVMVCEFVTDRRRRVKPVCRQPATAIVTEKGYQHAVCEPHRKRVERDNAASRSVEGNDANASPEAQP